MLGLVDSFGDRFVYAHVTAGGTRFLMLHDRCNDHTKESVRNFFSEIAEVYVKVRDPPSLPQPAPTCVSTPMFCSPIDLGLTQPFLREHGAYSFLGVRRARKESGT